MTDQSESLFWDNYISKTKAYRIKSTVARWYVRHAESYIKAHANLRLAQHSAPLMEKYLRDKGRNSYLEDWQYKQMVVALKILFVEMVKTTWANNFAWDDWTVAANSLPNSHATLARDYQSIEIDQNEAPDLDSENSASALYKSVFKRYPEHIRAFISQIRVRHYSIRTERAYLGWILRYISFYSMQDPAELTENHISRYLEYLVIRRKVASSTQSQALNALIFFTGRYCNAN